MRRLFRLLPIGAWAFGGMACNAMFNVSEHDLAPDAVTSPGTSSDSGGGASSEAGKHVTPSPETSSDSGVDTSSDAGNDATTSPETSSDSGVDTSSDAGNDATSVQDSGFEATAAPVCIPGSAQCVGNSVSTCTDAGTWSPATACPSQSPACWGDGNCGQCNPGQSGCTGSQPWTCDAGIEVMQPVTQGVCGAACTPGMQGCTATTPWTCDDAGVERVQPVTQGVCGAACSPGSAGCSGTTPWTCDSSGAELPGSVAVGVCGAVCTPGSTQCVDDAQEQQCQANGSWGSSSQCVNTACVGGGCTGMCSPGDERCYSATQTEVCSDTGTWNVSNCTANASCEIQDGGAVCACAGTQCSGTCLKCSTGYAPFCGMHAPSQCCASGDQFCDIPSGGCLSSQLDCSTQVICNGVPTYCNHGQTNWCNPAAPNGIGLCCPTGNVYCTQTPTICWSQGTVCSTTVQCADGTYHACSSSGRVYSCVTGTCI
jgi:hypothetical protein